MALVDRNTDSGDGGSDFDRSRAGDRGGARREAPARRGCGARKSRSPAGTRDLDSVTNNDSLAVTYQINLTRRF